MFKGTIADVCITREGKLMVQGYRESNLEAICQHVVKHYPEIVHAFLKATRPVLVGERMTDGNGHDLPTKVLVADDQFWFFGPTVIGLGNWSLQFELVLRESEFTLVVE